MTALAADRNTPRREAIDFNDPVLAATKIFAGAIVCLNAAGWAVPGSLSATQKCIGRARARADNSTGASGDVFVDSERGTFRFANSASTDLIARTEIGSDCYIVDDQTVAKTSASATRSIAGRVVDVDALGVWVRITR